MGDLGKLESLLTDLATLCEVGPDDARQAETRKLVRPPSEPAVPVSAGTPRPAQKSKRTSKKIRLSNPDELTQTAQKYGGVAYVSPQKDAALVFFHAKGPAALFARSVQGTTKLGDCGAVEGRTHYVSISLSA